MKRTAAFFLALVTAAALTGCGGSGSTGNDGGAPAAQSSAAGDAAPANNGSTAQQPAVITDGSKCGVLQKAAEQDALTLKGLILTTGSGHHDYPAIDELMKDGWKTDGLYSTYYLNEWIEVYADCGQEVSLYVVKNQPDTDYAAMTEADLIKISEAEAYPNAAAGLKPDAENNGLLTSFYVHQEMGEGLYNMCFVSGGKICCLVQLMLEPEPAAEE